MLARVNTHKCHEARVRELMSKIAGTDREMPKRDSKNKKHKKGKLILVKVTSFFTIQTQNSCSALSHWDSLVLDGRTLIGSPGPPVNFGGFVFDLREKMQFFGGSDISPSPPATTASGNNAHMMYVFNRNGVCLFYREWNRPLHTLSPQQDHKLMFGLLFSLKSLTGKMDPTSAEKGNLGMPQLLGQGCSFHSFRTNTYKLSFMETASGIKLILIMHPRTGDLQESLKYIYNLYVEYVVKNPLYVPGTPIRCELFNTTLDQYVRSIA